MTGLPEWFKEPNLNALTRAGTDDHSFSELPYGSVLHSSAILTLTLDTPMADGVADGPTGRRGWGPTNGRSPGQCVLSGWGLTCIMQHVAKLAVWGCTVQRATLRQRLPPRLPRLMGAMMEAIARDPLPLSHTHGGAVIDVTML